MVVGLGTAVSVLIWNMLQGVGAKQQLELPKDKFHEWIGQLEKVAPRSITVPKWLWGVGFIVFALGLYVFKNPAPALFGTALCIMIPDQLLYHRRKAHREAVVEQLAAAVRLFAAEFSVTPQIERGLMVVGNRIPDPVGRIFRLAYNQMICGMDADKVFAEMARGFDSIYGHMFVQLLRSARVQGQATAPLFHDLVSRIAVAQELAQANQGEISGERVVGLILTILPFPLYFLLQGWMPEARAFLADTASGRIIVSLSFLSGIVWFFIDRLVSEA